ncbi:5195_t:CDS:2 [Entrophospora sp. SA101]|nr:7277_t:CDS:2 [Entrophospora sp. SA101]CAJ0896440.1 5195_t:CDS:2 [Entrophospora sp. SA101]
MYTNPNQPTIGIGIKIRMFRPPDKKNSFTKPIHGISHCDYKMQCMEDDMGEENKSYGKEHKLGYKYHPQK